MTAMLDDFSPLPGVTDESMAVWQAEIQRVEHQAKTVTATDEEMNLELNCWL